jgi:putative redox protein
MVEVGIAYEGRLRCTAVHMPSRVELNTDAPVDNQGRGESFSPTDLVATGLGTCMLTIMGMVAQRHGINLDGTRVRVEKHMSSKPPRRIAKLVIQFEFAPGIPADRRPTLERSTAGCPVVKSIHPDIDVQVSYSYPD